MAASIAQPDLASVLAPCLQALPAATVSPEPAPGLLPFLSPILRQRVQLLSDDSTEPWIRLLCYDATKTAALTEIAQNGTLEPHPVSGDVEVDWDHDVDLRFRRLDEETLQAFVVLKEIGLAFRLVYCVNDQEGGGNGWRVGEITLPDEGDTLAGFNGQITIAEAERHFKETNSRNDPAPAVSVTADSTSGPSAAVTAVYGHDQDNGDDEDDDGYWDRYDATPSRTPAPKASPAPRARGAASSALQGTANADEADYYAQYDQVQPAMDNHDPDEEAQQAEMGFASSLNTQPHESTADATTAQDSWAFIDRNPAPAYQRGADEEGGNPEALRHPRPDSSASSNASHTVARLEELADRQGQHEFGVKQHISRSIRSLFLLSRASGIDREEFDRLVKTELDVMGMTEDLA